MGDISIELDELYDLLQSGVPFRNYFQTFLVQTYGESHPFQFDNNTILYKWSHQFSYLSIEMQFNNEGFLTYSNITKKFNQYKISYIWEMDSIAYINSGLNISIPSFPSGWFICVSILGFIVIKRKIIVKDLLLINCKK